VIDCAGELRDRGLAACDALATLIFAGIEIVREPVAEPYGTVAVFADLYGNLWDLIEPVKDRK